jgi:nitronate monooxygenase
LDPANLPQPDAGASNFGSSRIKPWKDIWSAGQGVGAIDNVLPTAQIVDGFKQEYAQAMAQLLSKKLA